MVDGRQSQQSASEISQGQLINRLNEDLIRHLESILICVNYCKMVEGNADLNIVERLAEQVQQELRLAERCRADQFPWRQTHNQTPSGRGTKPDRRNAPFQA